MKFQNRSIHGSKVNRRTDRQTDRQTDKPKAICPSNFFKVGGIIKASQFRINKIIQYIEFELIHFNVCKIRVHRRSN